jgi:hypothetical protein
MVRRYSYGRRRKARKKSALKPGVLPEGKVTFTGADLAAITDCEPKTLSAWRRQRILPRVPSRGLDTRYDRDHARRALAIAKAGVQAARLKRFAEMIPLILDEAPAPADARPSPSTAAGAAPAASQLAAHLAQLAPSAEPAGGRGLADHRAAAGPGAAPRRERPADHARHRARGGEALRPGGVIGHRHG